MQRKKYNRAILPTIVTTIISIIVVTVIFLLLVSWTPAAKVLHGTQARMYTLSSKVNTFFIQLIKSSESYKSQFEACKEEQIGYIQDATAFAELESRVHELEELLNYSQSVEYKTVPASILSRSSTNEHTLFIDQGENDGIKAGLAAVMKNGQCIGVVTSTSPYTSIITLLEDPSSSIPVKTISQEDTNGLLIGQGGYLLQMDYVPQSHELVIGDIIVTSGLDHYIPAGLIIGTINSVEKQDTAAFQKAFIEPVHKTGEYSTVLIIDTTNVTIYEE